MMALTIRIPGEMRGKGRPRFDPRSRRTYTDAKTANAETWIRSCAVEQIGNPCVEMPVALDIVCGIEIPKSWSKVKQRRALAGELHPVTRPDCDNMIKLIADALNGIAWRDDAQVYRVSMVKRYAEAPETLLTITLAEQAAFCLRPAIAA